MAFSFGNSGGGAFGGGGQTGGNVQKGPKLEDITTQALGFLALAGESKIRLLPSWPSDNLPPPTSSLMAISSRRGLIAAAGPDVIVVATTESLHKAFEAQTGNNIKPFEPQLKIPMPMRVSQLAFSADDSYLVLSAESGGGLAVYEVDALLNGSTQTAFELPTNGEALRALIPNPTREKGELFAVVTVEGNLMIANLKDRTFKSGPNGQVLRNGVSCVSWSTKGKQLVAGLGNGTACQMTPEGEVKAEIPRVPGLDDNNHVSSITWLENNVFLLVHTSSNNSAPNSTFHLATRQPPSSYTFQELADPTPPFGLDRSTPHHFILRLKDFPPNLQDLLVVGSSASTDINLFTRSKVPLSTDKPADSITGVFTLTEMADDSRRAQLPGSLDGVGDTSPIGFALDLSSKIKVWKPIPGDDQIDESPHPVPALMVLNNEGILASWWIIYSESIRQGTPYRDLVAVEGMAPPQQATTATPAFGSAGGQSFGNQAPTTSAFGGAMAKPVASTGAFGSTSTIGQKQSPWGGQSFGTPSFGAPSMTPAANTGTTQPTFGTATSLPAFGQAGLPGRTSVWGAAPSSGTAFGQSSTLGSSKPVFGSSTLGSGNQSQASAFTSFANKGGFAAAAAPASGGSIFGSKPATSSAASGSVFGSNNTPSTSGGIFGSNNATNTGSSAFGAPSNTSVFGGGNQSSQPSSTFGGNAFTLGTTFKADTSKESEPDNAKATSSTWGGFGTALNEAEKAPQIQTPVSKETDMDTEDVPIPEEPAKIQSTTPSSTPAPAKSPFFTAPPSTGLFGSTTNKPAQGSDSAILGGQAKPNPFSLGSTDTKTAPNPFAAAAFPKAAPTPASPPVTIKQEPSDKETIGVSQKIPEAPLPPDPTSKSSYAIGETSASGSENDAPLPPDFAPKPKPLASIGNDAPLPPDFARKPKSSTSIGDDAPLPPDFALKPKPTQTPPVETIKPQSPPESPNDEDIPGGPDDEGDDSDFLTEDEGDALSKEPSDEGSGEDLGKLDSPTSELNVTPGLTPQNSFGKQNGRVDTSPFAKIQKPTSFGQSKGLFGEISASAPVLPPPKAPLNPPRSPRSPSPVRSAVPPRMMRPDASRSVSAPSVASKLLGAQKPPVRPITPSQSTYTTTVEQEKAQEQRRVEARARKEVEETRSLIDDEDERLQRYLAEDIEPTRTLDEFIAHSDVQRPESVDSIPAQVEILYRDINSMIDTLGLNAKALKSFIKGHTEQYKEDRSKDDLEDNENWCLDEIDALSYIVEKELGRELEMGRIQEADKIKICEDLQKELAKLRQKHEDVKKIVASYTHPDHIATARAQPLNAEQTSQQNDLRRDYLKFQQLLSEAEEGLTVLRAKIASQSSSNGNSKTAAPTVEAIMRTITKMTSMAEKRSGDVDVLENQMRKLRFGTASREGSPALKTPQKNRLSMRINNTPGTSSTNRMFYTPDSNFKGSASRRMGGGGSMFALSGGGGVGSASFMGSPSPRKKISGWTGEEKRVLCERGRRKMDIREKLRGAVVGANVGVKALGDDDDEGFY